MSIPPSLYKVWSPSKVMSLSRSLIAMTWVRVRVRVRVRVVVKGQGWTQSSPGRG